MCIVQEGEGHVRASAEGARLPPHESHARRAGEEPARRRPAPPARTLRLLRAGASHAHDQVPDGDEGEDAHEAGTRPRTRRSSRFQERAQDEGAYADVRRNLFATLSAR